MSTLLQGFQLLYCLVTKLIASKQFSEKETGGKNDVALEIKKNTSDTSAKNAGSAFP